MAPLVFRSVEAARAAFALAPEGLEFRCSVCGKPHRSDRPNDWWDCLRLLEKVLVKWAHVRFVHPFPKFSLPPFWVTGMSRDSWYCIRHHLSTLLRDNSLSGVFRIDDPCYLAVPPETCARHQVRRMRTWRLEALRRFPQATSEGGARYREVFLRLKRCCLPVEFPEVRYIAPDGMALNGLIESKTGDGWPHRYEYTTDADLCAFLLNAAVGFASVSLARFYRALLPPSAREFCVTKESHVLLGLNVKRNRLRADTLFLLAYRRRPVSGKIFVRIIRLRFDWKAGRPRPVVIVGIVPRSETVKGRAFRAAERLREMFLTPECAPGEARLVRRILRGCKGNDCSLRCVLKVAEVVGT